MSYLPTWKAAALACVAIVAAADEATAQTPVLSRAQRAELLARAQLDSGKFGASRATFDDMLRVAETRRDSASSIFGKTFAEQQTIEFDSVPRNVAGRLIREYQRAATLDSTRYQSAAQLNIALLYSAAGRHDSAAHAYVRAARTGDSLQGAMLLGAAREFQLARQRPAAIARARQAAADPAVAAEAQALLVDLYHESRDRTSLVQLAETLQARTAPLSQVNDALAEMMQDREWSSSQWGERCLITLARNSAALDMGPLHFSETQRPLLQRAAEVNAGTRIGSAMEALLDAYRRRDAVNVYRPHTGASWWMTATPDDRRRAAWSTTLRKLGDWYARAGAPRVAISFYEEALGGPGVPVDQEWVDVEALPPLPGLYATLPDTGALWDGLLKVEALTNALYQSKSAMRPDNLRRLRLVRLTLGHLFAQQGRWDNGWRGAIRQLEESRNLAKQMVSANPREAPHFPTEVYELLFAEYVRRGCRAEALSVGRELQAEYERRRADIDERRIAREMTRLQGAAPVPPTRPCSGL